MPVQAEQPSSSEHKADEPVPSSSSSSAVNSSPSSNSSPLPAVSSISSVHCGALNWDSTKLSSVRSSPSSLPSWVQSKFPNVSAHSVLDYQSSRFLHLHFRSES